jgi:dihydroorotate dehydrogenase (NAD+) catalytic subunit
VEQNISTKIGSLNLEKPTILASGILGISLDVFNRIYRAGAGAVVSKSLSKEPWEGYANPTIFSVKGDGWLNAVGLSNPGAAHFAKMIEPNKEVPIIVSLVGSVENDFVNLSCPHVDKVGLDVGDDPELVKKIVKAVKAATNVPVFVKIGLGTIDYLETVSVAIEAGVDGITAINTLRAMAIDVETERPILSNKIGGYSHKTYCS